MKWETTTMCFQFDSQSGIVEIRPNKNFKALETLDHAKENLETGLSRVGDVAKAIVIEMPDHYVSAEVTRYYRDHVPDMPLALVANSYFKRMIGNFILSLNTTTRPTKMFKDFEEAHLWVDEVLQANNISD